MRRTVFGLMVFLGMATLAMAAETTPTDFKAGYLELDTLKQNLADNVLQVLGIQQIAVSGLDKTRLRTLWVDILGLNLIGNYQSEFDNVDEDIAEIGSGPFKVEVDLMQPLDPDKKPRVQSPPLNHVGLWIDDLPAAVAWLKARGVRFTPGGIRKGASGFDICFIHPKGNEASPVGGEGVLIELVQTPLEVRQAFGRLAGQIEQD